MWLMQRLNYPQKFILIGLLFMLPLGLVMYDIIVTIQQDKA